MDFANAMTKEATSKLTENGVKAYYTFGDDLIDLFSQIGSLRNRSEEDVIKKFKAAFKEHQLFAVKMLFYAGNIRGGLGERKTFRICLRWLAKNHPDIVIKNIENIPFYNRYDSLFELIGTEAEEAMWQYINKEICSDIRKAHSKLPCSLLAKWMPSENASSIKTKNLANTAMRHLNLTPRRYRKTLSYLRNYIDVVEAKMSTQNWEGIKYEAVPSYAMSHYTQAFKKHDYERFVQYVENLKAGKTKINAATLFPYDLVKNYLSWNYNHKNLLVEEQWKALPNYIDCENNIVIMADVSGSMTGRPMATSVGLAIYFAEHNQGAYHNLYMTFTDQPRFVSIKEGATLHENVRFVERAGVGYNTNLEAAFSEILKMAVQNSLTNEELPKALLIVSDMEIDNVVSREGLDFVETMKRRFARYGYKMPKLIMWNVEARNDTFLSQSPDVIMVSGQSASVFKSFINCLNGETAYDVMIKTLNDKMYDKVII